MTTTYLTLPRKRNVGVKTEQLRYGPTIRSRPDRRETVFLRSMRLFTMQTGYARGGEPGVPGHVVGYQVTVDDYDGCEVYHVEVRHRYAAEELFRRVQDHTAEFLEASNG